MKKYNLLPNDSIIVATCKFYKISNLASYDSGLIEVCKNEKIVLIDKVEKLV
jgi:predicted nucleic acid-binding protein